MRTGRRGVLTLPPVFFLWVLASACDTSPISPPPPIGPACADDAECEGSASDACGGLVRGGERVKLRVSIAGPSGSITSTAVVDDADNPQLAACAAQEVARLPVKKVQKAQIGAMLTLKF